LFRYPFASRYLVLVIPALIVEVLLLDGFGLIVSSLTVYLRDIAHFMELALLFWFWMTPVVYAPNQVYMKFLHHHLPFAIYLLNPMTSIVLCFQRAFYKTVTPLYHGNPAPVLINFHLGTYFSFLGVLAAVAVVLIWVGFAVFGKGEGNFAEEL